MASNFLSRCPALLHVCRQPCSRWCSFLRVSENTIVKLLHCTNTPSLSPHCVNIERAAPTPRRGHAAHVMHLYSCGTRSACDVPALRRGTQRTYLPLPLTYNADNADMPTSYVAQTTCAFRVCTWKLDTPNGGTDCSSCSGDQGDKENQHQPSCKWYNPVAPFAVYSSKMPVWAHVGLFPEHVSRRTCERREVQRETQKKGSESQRRARERELEADRDSESGSRHRAQ